VKKGFRGKIISTQPTRDLTRIILLDSVKLQREGYERSAQKIKIKNGSHPEGDIFTLKKPMYDEQDVHKAMELFQVYSYGRSVDLNNCLEFRMRDAGHILGSSIFEFWVHDKNQRPRKLVFSGDLGQPGQRIIRDPDMIRDADYVIVESTYGDRLHKNKDETVLELLKILTEARDTSSNVVIPTFAIERTQELLYELNLFYEKGLIENMPVYLDSPMAIEATEVFKQYPTFYDEDAKRLLEKGDNPFEFNEFKNTGDVEDSKRLAGKKGIVIMAGSGMCTGGRVLHHLKNNIENENSHIVFVGFQVKGTLGRDIVDGASTVEIHGKKFTVKSQVHTLGGFSAHGDKRDLEYWLRGYGRSPKLIILVHGEESVVNSFANNIKQEMHVDTFVPKLNEKVEIE